MKLNDTQKQILKLIVQGKSNYEIAEQLNYSLANIKKNIQFCYKFFNVRNRASLVRETMLLLLAENQLF